MVVQLRKAVYSIADSDACLLFVEHGGRNSFSACSSCSETRRNGRSALTPHTDDDVVSQ